MSGSQVPEFMTTYEEEPFTTSIVRTVKEKPLGVAAMGAFLGGCGYGIWRYKTKGATFSPSLFLIQFRVGVQSLVVGCISLGMLYNMAGILMKKKEKN